MITDLPVSTGPCPASFWRRHWYMVSVIRCWMWICAVSMIL